MLIPSQKAEEQALMDVACAMCAAARTAPKACGMDQTDTAIVTGEDKAKLTAEMRRIAGEQGERAAFLLRDADNVDASGAVVLVGAQYKVRGLGEICGACGFANCKAARAAGAGCVHTSIDLGIALGSAVALAAGFHVDNRIMFSIGKAAAALGLLGNHKLIMGIPLSISGKSPFFDRKAL